MLKDIVFVEWNKEDDLTLVERIQNVLPVNDTLTFNRRLALVDFEEARRINLMWYCFFLIHQ